MTRRTQLLAGVSVALVMLAGSYAYGLTGDEALGQFKKRMHSIGTMSGVISWSDPTGMTYSGNFRYRAPGMIYITFNTPSGKILVSNGKKLWIHDKGSNICGVQDLAGGGSGGIASLVNGYAAIVTARGSSGYTIRLKNREKPYTDITLMLDASFLLKRAIFKTAEGAVTTYTLSNVRVGDNIVAGIFDYQVPTNAQLVNNPLNIR